MSNEDLFASTFLEKSELGGTTQRLPLRAERDAAPRVMCTNIHNASHQTTLPAAEERWPTRLAALAALRIWQRTLVKILPFEQMHL